MASTGAGYDWAATTYSPDGRMYQVEYAMKAVESTGTGVGVRCLDGVVLACESTVPNRMMKEGATSRRHFAVSKHIGICVSGNLPDARQIATRARLEAASYKDQYGIEMPPDVMRDRVANFVHVFTCHQGLRPFGVSTMIAAYDPDLKEHSLSLVEPSGVGYKFFGCATGKGRQAGKTEVEKLDLPTLTCAEALKEMARIVHLTRSDDSSGKPYVVEMTWLCEATGWRLQKVPKAMQAEAEAWAKAKLEDADDSSGDEMEDEE